MPFGPVASRPEPPSVDTPGAGGRGAAVGPAADCPSPRGALATGGGLAFGVCVPAACLVPAPAAAVQHRRSAWALRWSLPPPTLQRQLQVAVRRGLCSSPLPAFTMAAAMGASAAGAPLQPVPVIYHIQFWSSSRVVHLIEELGLTPRQVVVKVITDAQLKGSPELAALNPQKKLPFMLDTDGQTILESGALCALLLERYDHSFRLWPAPGHPRRAKALQWLHYGPASAFPLAVKMFMATFGVDPIKQDIKVIEDTKREWLRGPIKVLEKELADGRKWLLGEDYTVADIVMSYDMMTMSFTGVPGAHGTCPRVAAWFDRASSRPAYKKLYSPPS